MLELDVSWTLENAEAVSAHVHVQVHGTNEAYHARVKVILVYIPVYIFSDHPISQCDMFVAV